MAEDCKLKDDVNIKDFMELKNFDHQGIILKHFGDDEINRDLVIKTEQGYIQCHKLLLAAASPLFCQMLEEIPCEDTALVIMTEFPSTEVKKMISAIYSISDSETDLNQDTLLKFFTTNLPLVMERHNVVEKEEVESFTEEIESGENTFLSGNESMVVLPDICDDNIDFFGEFSDEEEVVKKKKQPAQRRGRKKKKKKKTSTTKPPTPGTITGVPKRIGRPRKYPMLCPFCSVRIESRREKPKHVCKFDKENGQSTNIICHLCGIRFLNKSSLTAHLSMQCENVCELCKEVFQNRTEVREHMFVAHHKVLKRRVCNEVDRPFQCDKCDKSYTKDCQLKIHIKTHTEIAEKFQCQDCGKFLSTKLALKKHVSLHRPPDIPCPICGKLFHNKSYLSRHAISQHADQDVKPHRCDMCPKGFNNKNALDGHRNWHLNLKPYKCRWCDRTYQNTSNCSAHERKSHRELYESLLTHTNRRVQMKDDSIVDIIRETTIVHV